MDEFLSNNTLINRLLCVCLSKKTIIMKKSIVLFVFVLHTFLSCTESMKNSSTGISDEKFQKLSEDFLKGYLDWRPEYSVSLGLHEYDGKTSDFSKESLKKELARLKTYDQMLAEFDTTTLSQVMYFDYRILRCGIRNEIFNFEDMESYTKNPMTYAGAIDVSSYIKRNFDTLEERLKSIITVESKAQEIFADAKANLADSLAKPFIETAIKIAEGSAAFLESDLILALKEVKNDSLMAAFKTANTKAVTEIKAFVEYLEKEKLPKANNNYALGKVKYQKMLLGGEFISMSSEQILKIGLAELEREKEEFNTSAKIIDPSKNPIEVYNDLRKEHPTSDSLILSGKKNVEAIRKFLIDKKIVTIQPEAGVQVKEMPKYTGAIFTAFMDTPGPFERKATEAYYYITPVDPGWTAKQKEDWLSMFNYYTTDMITIHEVYPGHYLQFTHLNTSSASKIEEIFMSYAFIEGWAHYTEKLMIDEGYGSNGDPIKVAKYRLAQSAESLLRLCRLCVSVKMHCEDMSVDDATKFFMDNWHQGEKPSRQEAIRGTFDPGYLYYTFGKLQMLKLREDFKKQEGDKFNLQKFHDLVLKNGMPPIQLLRERLLKDKNVWSEIL